MDYLSDDYHKYLSKIKAYKKLSLKRQLFLRHLLSDPRRHGVTAAIKACYPKKSAQSMSSQIMSECKDVIEEYDIMVAADNANLRVRIVKELCLIAFSNINEFMKWSKDSMELIESKKLKDELASVIQEIEIYDTMFGVKKKMKTHSKMDAIKELNKMHGFYTDVTVNVNNPDGNMTPQITVTIPSNGREKKK